MKQPHRLNGVFCAGAADGEPSDTSIQPLNRDAVSGTPDGIPSETYKTFALPDLRGYGAVIGNYVDEYSPDTLNAAIKLGAVIGGPADEFRPLTRQNFSPGAVVDKKCR